MNINHVKEDGIIVPETFGGILHGIFERQDVLHKKYMGIEHKNGLGLAIVENEKFSFDSPRWQYVIKDFAWRVTEELTEALEARNDGNVIHTLEELIDSLHFYTELLIVCGYTAQDVEDSFIDKASDRNYDFMSPVYELGLACNLLKNKPWKNSHLVTDTERFRGFILEGYCQLMRVIIAAGVIDFSNMFMIYFKKSVVNIFRQESNY